MLNNIVAKASSSSTADINTSLNCFSSMSSGGAAENVILRIGRVLSILSVYRVLLRF